METVPLKSRFWGRSQLQRLSDNEQDKFQRWRIVHTVLNGAALLLILGTGLRGARELLIIPLNWPEAHIYQLGSILVNLFI